MEPIETVGHPNDEHPSDARLLSWLADGLPADQVEGLLRHLDLCPRCERRLEMLEPAFADCRRGFDLTHARVPRPDAPWVDIGSAMLDLERTRPVVRERSRSPWFLRVAGMSAIAAAVFLAALLVLPHGGVRAEEMLARAQSSPKPPARRQLRVKTRTASYTRPASRAGAEENDLRARFAAAHYDWDDPLSAKSYADWFHRQAHKTGYVSIQKDPATRQPLDYTIQTNTPDGELREASLTLQAASLAPVSGKFLFADREWVEIAAVPETGPESAAVSPSPEEHIGARMPDGPPQPHAAPDPIAAESPAARELAARELKVRLAIDALQPHGEAGAPVTVEVEADHRIVVTPYHLAPGRESQLRASLAGIEGVVVSAPQGTAETSGSASVAAPEGSIESVIDASQAIAAQAHFLRQLELRFDAATEATLDPSDRQRLHDMRARHAAQLIDEIDSLSRRLKENHPGFREDDAAPELATLVDAAGAVDRLVTGLLAGTARLPDEASQWRRLGADVARVRALAVLYRRTLAEGRQ